MKMIGITINGLKKYFLLFAVFNNVLMYLISDFLSEKRFSIFCGENQVYPDSYVRHAISVLVLVKADSVFHVFALTEVNANDFFPGMIFISVFALSGK